MRNFSILMTFGTPVEARSDQASEAVRRILNSNKDPIVI